MYLYKHHLLPTSWCFVPQGKHSTMAGLETSVGEEVLYINLKCSKGKNWYYITNYLLALPLPCCVLCPLYTALHWIFLLYITTLSVMEVNLFVLQYTVISSSNYLTSKRISKQIRQIEIRVGLGFMLRVSAVLGYHYQALTRLGYQGFENRLDDKPRVRTSICQSLKASRTFAIGWPKASL